MPREVPGTISMAPFFASAFKCSSAAFGERNPNSLAISARVGGIPVASIWERISSKISLCLGVNGRIVSACLSIQCAVSIYSILSCASNCLKKTQKTSCGFVICVYHMEQSKCYHSPYYMCPCAALACFKKASINAWNTMKKSSWMQQLLRWPIRLVTRFKAIVDEHGTQPSARDHVVYVMRSPSTTDLLVAQRAAEELNLPDPTAPFLIEGKEFPRVLYVSDDRHRLEYDAIDPFTQLLELHQENPSLDVIMHPVALFWGREPGKDSRDGHTMVADVEVPGKWKKFLLVLFSGRNILVRVSQPVSLRTMADMERGGKEVAHKLLRVARTHFARIRYAVAGPKLSGREEIINELLRLPAIKKVIEEEAKTKKISVAAA